MNNVIYSDFLSRGGGGISEKPKKGKRRDIIPPIRAL